jgi:hypothetical protein
MKQQTSNRWYEKPVNDKDVNTIFLAIVKNNITPDILTDCAFQTIYQYIISLEKENEKLKAKEEGV